MTALDMLPTSQELALAGLKELHSRCFNTLKRFHKLKQAYTRYPCITRPVTGAFRFVELHELTYMPPRQAVLDLRKAQAQEHFEVYFAVYEERVDPSQFIAPDPPSTLAFVGTFRDCEHYFVITQWTTVTSVEDWLLANIPSVAEDCTT